MSVKYGKFEMPESVLIENLGENQQRIIVSPLQPGFATTMGVALRRALYNSIEAPAIVSVTFEGVSHEYTAIEGVLEDMTHVVLNLKGSLLRVKEESSVADFPPRAYHLLQSHIEVTAADLANQGYQQVTLQQLIPSNSWFEVVNKNAVVFTVTKPFSKKISLRVQIGRGYEPADTHEVTDRLENEIFIDAIFSPVRKVNYFVENARVGQETDYDRLVLEVTTDGRIDPRDCVTFAAQILIEHFSIFEKIRVRVLTFGQEENSIQSDREAMLQSLGKNVGEIELSVRSMNCLAGANIETIGELVLLTENDLLKYRNFGRKSLHEIRQKLLEMNLSLGMDLGRYGISKLNVKNVMDDYRAEQMGKMS